LDITIVESDLYSLAVVLGEAGVLLLLAAAGAVTLRYVKRMIKDRT